MKKKIVFIVGPTAVGKSDIAAVFAKKTGGEIISCDSMQIYKGMDVITSKPSATLKKKVPHHLIDIVSPEAKYDVFKYRKAALKKIKEITQRGNIPVFAGGTGLYMTILVDGIFAAKSQAKAVRNRLTKEAQVCGSRHMHERLQKVDPEAAAKIHPNDPKRIIRALEVFECTGKPISRLKEQRSGLSAEYDVRIFCLNMERGRLYKRIDARVDKMFRQGLLAEVKKLLKLKLGKTASFAIGLRELKGYFEKLYSLDEAKLQMKHNSRLYAKRQLTWFRKDKRIKWIEIGETEKPPKTAERIIWKKPL